MQKRKRKKKSHSSDEQEGEGYLEEISHGFRMHVIFELLTYFFHEYSGGAEIYETQRGSAFNTRQSRISQR
jgi:hypothetical protein